MGCCVNACYRAANHALTMPAAEANNVSCAFRPPGELNFMYFPAANRDFGKFSRLFQGIDAASQLG
jgi:hypothetical protein